MAALYIIGAGCSKNYSECTSPVPGLEPPLNADFFKMAKKVIDFYDLTSMHGPVIGLDYFTRHLNRMYGYGDSESDTSVYNDDRLDLEGVMTHFHLEHELLGLPQHPSVSIGVRSSRVQALNGLLAYTITESLRGPICKRHMLLAEKIQRGDMVWNFNYDLLLDNALYMRKKFTDLGYVMRFDHTLVDNDWQKPEDSPSEVTLLKLHGSLNWLKCIVCGCSLLLRYKKPVPEIWENTRIPLLMHCPKCTQTTNAPSLVRVIVPPSLVKSFGDTELRFLWRYACSINNLDRIVVIGFRFAEQDAEVEMLLREMFRRGRIRSDISIHIVNPTPEKVEERFKSIFVKSEITCESPISFFKS